MQQVLNSFAVCSLEAMRALPIVGAVFIAGFQDPQECSIFRITRIELLTIDRNTTYIIIFF